MSTAQHEPIPFEIDGTLVGFTRQIGPNMIHAINAHGEPITIAYSLAGARRAIRRQVGR